MSDGLFQSDPSHKPRSSLTESKKQASTMQPPAASLRESIIPPSERQVEESSSGAADEPFYEPIEQSDAVAAQVASDHPTAPLPDTPSWLDGLEEEQPLHRPAATAVPRPPELTPSDYVPTSQTGAPWSFRAIGRLYSASTGPTAVALAVALAGLLALYVYFQVLALLATLATLPTWLAAIAVVLLSLLIAVVVLAFGRLAVVYFRLRRNEQIRMSDIQQLQRHAQIRRGCSPSQQRQQAKSVLEVYVREYPEYEVENTGHRPKKAHDPSMSQPYASACPFTDEQLRRLHRARRRLADPARVKDTKEWLAIYAAEFQDVLDAAARDRVHQCAKWVGVKTAISPNALVDTLITTYWCFVLLRDLCAIYNVRVGGYGTAALLWRSFFSAYLAGKLQDWEDHADDTIESMIDGLPEIGRNILGKLAAKAGTGLANYFMVRRLGRRAIALLRPLAVEQH
jgi:uncharacterized membrane protein YcjF (UPF0283 family)